MTFVVVFKQCHIQGLAIVGSSYHGDVSQWMRSSYFCLPEIMWDSVTQMIKKTYITLCKVGDTTFKPILKCLINSAHATLLLRVHKVYRLKCIHKYILILQINHSSQNRVQFKMCACMSLIMLKITTAFCWSAASSIACSSVYIKLLVSQIVVKCDAGQADPYYICG